MATKSIDKKKTLEYAVAFYFYDSGCVNFMMGNIMYQHIKTIYDERADGRRLGKIEFGVRNSVPSAKEIKEAIKDGFPNGTTYKLLVPTSVCINQ